MRRARTTIAALATAALLTPAADADAKRFYGQAIGNSASGLVAKRSFPIGAGYGLRFRDDQRASTPYRVCAFFNGRRRGRCLSGRTGSRPGASSNKNSFDAFNPQQTGRLTWRWYVGGKAVARWTVRITIGD